MYCDSRSSHVCRRTCGAHIGIFFPPRVLNPPLPSGLPDVSGLRTIWVTGDPPARPRAQGPLLVLRFRDDDLPTTVRVRETVYSVDDATQRTGRRHGTRATIGTRWENAGNEYTMPVDVPRAVVLAAATTLFVHFLSAGKINQWWGGGERDLNFESRFFSLLKFFFLWFLFPPPPVQTPRFTSDRWRRFACDYYEHFLYTTHRCYSHL